MRTFTYTAAGGVVHIAFIFFELRFEMYVYVVDS